MKVENVTLENLKGGAVSDLFAVELERVLRDIADPNAEPCATRSIALTFAFCPADDRSRVSLTVKAKTKLGGTKPTATTIYTAEREGRVLACEFDPRQLTIGEAIAAAEIVNFGGKEQK